jgi:hypothetical protein
MNVVTPAKILDEYLVSSNVPEDDETEWDSGDAPYSENDVVMVTTTANGASIASHRIYRSTADTNNEDPTLRTTYDSGGDDVLWWEDLGPTNRWKMFDEVVQRQTENADSIEVVLELDQLFDTIAFLNVDAVTIDVEIEIDSEVVYDETINMLQDDDVGDWWEYFNIPINYRENAVVINVPGYQDATLTVTFHFDGGTAKVGAMVPGVAENIGRTQYGLELGIQDFSRKETDGGLSTIDEGPFLDDQRALVKIETGKFDRVNRLLKSRRALPTVYFADADFPGTLLYGFFVDFRIMIPGPRVSECMLELEGIADV